NVLLVVYYLIPTYLGFEVVNKWVFRIQQILTREPSFQTWAPTSLSYVIVTVTVTLILWAIFGWGHLLLAKKDLREIIPGKMAAVIITYASILTLPLFLLLVPLAFDHYVAADENALYY